MKDVAGKVAFITGGASGMGLAMARSFSAAGMKVAITDIEQSAPDRVKGEFVRSNAEVIHLKLHATDRDAMQQAPLDTEANCAKVHMVCTTAGVAGSGRSEVRATTVTAGTTAKAAVAIESRFHGPGLTAAPAPTSSPCRKPGSARACAKS